MNCLITTSGFEVAFFLRLDLLLAKENLEGIFDYIVKRQGQKVVHHTLNKCIIIVELGYMEQRRLFYTLYVTSLN